MKWGIYRNDELIDFDNDFNNAVSNFKKCICMYLEESEDAFNDGVPFKVGAFFSYKYDNGSINKEDVFADLNLQMLLLTFNFDLVTDGLLKCTKEIKYEGSNEEFDETVDISVKKTKNEIIVDVVHDDGEETYLKTNVFIFDDNKKDYYFKSHQIINTTSYPEKLRKICDIDLLLKPIAE